MVRAFLVSFEFIIYNYALNGPPKVVGYKIGISFAVFTDKK